MSELFVPPTGGPVAVPPPPDKKPCRVCATDIPIDAIRCTVCESWQNGKNCIVCGAWILKSAKRCESCKSFQDWRRRIPGNEVVLALLVSLFSVLGTAIPAIVHLVRLPSDTTATLLDAELDPAISSHKRVLLVRAFNSGGSSSIVRGAALNLESVQAGTVKLTNKTPKQSEVPANKQTDIKFFAPIVRPQPGATKEQVATNLCSAEVELLLEIDEKPRFGKLAPREQPLRVPVPGRLVRDWVLDKMTVEAQPCPGE